MGAASDRRAAQSAAPAAPGRSGSAASADAPFPAGLPPRRTSHRPEVRPADPGTPGECLCGDPAEFVVDTYWFNGRHSRDPVCEHHVAEVVAAITEKQRRRDGR